MTTEKLNRLRTYVFAQYIGQKVLMHPTVSWKSPVTGNNLLGEQYAKDCYLHLRALSSITDAERKQICDLLERFTIPISQVDDLITIYLNRQSNLTGNEWWKLYQYLQQQGFALPVYFDGELYSVARLVELGIVKLSE